MPHIRQFYRLVLAVVNCETTESSTDANSLTSKNSKNITHITKVMIPNTDIIEVMSKLPL